MLVVDQTHFELPKTGKPYFNGCAHLCTSQSKHNLWNVTPSSPLKVERHFGGICRLQLALLATCFIHIGFLLGLFFGPETSVEIQWHYMALYPRRWNSS
jgi:hypothetical protein